MSEARTLSSPEATEALLRVGSAEILVGLVTLGPTPPVAQVARVAREALEGPLGNRPAVVVHVDPTRAEEPRAAVAEAVGPLPLIQLEASEEQALASPGSAVDRSDGVRTILAIADRLGCRATIVLNPAQTSTTPAWVGALAEPVLKEGLDLALPVYQRTRHEGTLGHAFVIPLVRALFGRRLSHPLAEEFACSGSAVGRLAAHALWAVPSPLESDLWLPVAAIEQRLAVGQVALGRRLVQSSGHAPPLGTTVGEVAGTLFEVADRFETLWLEVRGSETVPTFGPEPEMLPGGASVDPERLLGGFQQGVRDLYEIWARILSPEHLDDILALSQLPSDQFRFPDRLWTRVVYDFLLGWHFRVAHRRHVARSLAPLYLGRAASVVLETHGQAPGAVATISARLARNFEQDKPYLVDRWR